MHITVHTKNSNVNRVHYNNLCKIALSSSSSSSTVSPEPNKLKQVYVNQMWLHSMYLMVIALCVSLS